jgi:hypothetical protein
MLLFSLQHRFLVLSNYSSITRANYLMERPQLVHKEGIMFSRKAKKNSTFRTAVEILGSLLVVFLLFGCGSGGGGGGGGGGKDECPATTLDIIVCDPAAGGPFSLTIDNEFFPLVVGDLFVLEGVDDGELIHLEITVLDETEDVAGVTTRVLEEAEWVDGELAEISRNFFAQAPDGTVCYFGEDVDIYENGVVVSNAGAWRAGVNGALPGIFMPGNPQIGDIYANEYAAGVAEDQAEVIDTDEPISVPAGDFVETLTIEECNPLEDAEKDIKVFVRGIGLAIDGPAELISF